MRTLEGKRNAARKLIARTEMDDQMIADIEEFPVEEVEKLRAEIQPALSKHDPTSPDSKP
ncbi:MULTISPECIES: hypothetical protein [unclassified Halomonas]|uniref:hypothetical protein n=1 Tax=unclassified Halomonas TaxID=2609666 RepID=UPI0007D8E262|nr:MULTISPECIES: hypothetical protein [unclassified Halomonas]MBT2785507.1 hypothetical protein [Halomonas sp. ISL-106]MBT2797809.1 hypothetical protein [Halomonas sp. ISL-104]OAL59353.1 hypothetical protein A6R74_03845 [Halomonas sp. ALS9]